LHRLSAVSCLTILFSFGVIVLGFINETNRMTGFLKSAALVMLRRSLGLA